MRRIIATSGTAILGVAIAASGLWAEDGPDGAKLEVEPAIAKAQALHDQHDGPEKKFRDFHEVTKGAEKIDGLFTLYRKDDHLYAEIKPQQLDQPLLVPIAIARGLTAAGHPLNFGDEWVIAFKRVNDKIQLLRKNIHYKAPAGSALDRAVKQAYTDSILMALPIVTINPAGGSVVIDFSDIFLGNFARFPLGNIDRSRTSWHKVKGFPNNVELEVEATFGGGGSGGPFFLDDGVIDPRGITVVIHYSLMKLPDPGYRPRYADDRVGHFLSALKDFGNPDPDTNFVRQINRWRLEKANPKAKLSAPKKRILWYVENTVPEEYRPYVEEGILEWNKAFEKIGFKDAIEVRWQRDDGRDEFDPEDTNYCTFRWITSGSTYAMSGLRANPLTGEMIDGDVVFDASWIKEFQAEYAFLTGTPPGPVSGGDRSALDAALAPPLAVGRVISPIMAAKKGFGLPFLPPGLQPQVPAERPEAIVPRAVPADGLGLRAVLTQRMAAGQYTGCQFSSGMRSELGLAAIALRSFAEEDKDGAKTAEKVACLKDACSICAAKGDCKGECQECQEKAKKEAQAQKDKEKENGPKIPEELIGQGIKEIVMHEVGHSLGLRHNFKASSMLTAEQLHDVELTKQKGLCGSVMDYMPINIAPKGQKQGFYYTPTIGPYDYWAIEYAYKPIDGNEEAELKKIAARASEPGLAYATDEDMYQTHDPQVNAWDYGSDNLEFAKNRILLASQLMKDLDKKIVKDGESWARVRTAFSILLNQWGNGAYLVSEYIGGQSVSRSHKADKGAPDPIVPVPGAKQRDALKFLVDQVLSDKAFKFSPSLLRKLTTERWYHWGANSLFFGGGVDYPVNEEILAIQSIVLRQCLDADVLTRLENQETAADEDSHPLKMAEVFRALTDGIWSECGLDGPKDQPVSCSTIRRNLQRAYLKRLITMVLGQRGNPYNEMYGYISFYHSPPVPADAKSLARLHLKEIDERIGKVLDQKDARVDDTTRAHLDECRTKIKKALEAHLQMNES
jgi:hypothetical protein